MNEVVKSLYEDTEKFNKEAVEQARKNKEETSKYLIAELEKIIDEVDENTLEVPLFVDYAIFLLAEFHEKKAYPVILKLLNLRNIDNDEFLGYGIMDQLPSIITSVFDGNYDALNRIIEDKEKEWYLKARLLASYSYFYDHHMIKKEELIAYLRKLVNHNNDEQNMINNTILDIITDCHLFEMMEDVKKMYDEDVLEYELSEGYADFIDRIFNYDNREEIVSKSVEEYMAGWYHFDKEIKPQLEKNTFQKFANYLEKEAEQYEIDYSKVGRNDKCPCGSGKKFKKCCIDKVKSRLSYQKYINQALSKYPKENNNPDEKDFYSYYKKEYIEIDHLLYKALKRKEIPLFIKRDIKKELDQDYEYLNQAYPLIKNIIEQNNFKTIEEYDKKVEIHYSLYSFFIRYSRCIIEKAKMDKSEYIQKLEELIKYFYDHFEIAKEYEYVFLNKINEYYILSKKEKEAIAFFENKLKDSDIRSRYDAYDYLFQDYIDIYSYDEARRKIEDLIEKEKDETLKEELEILKLDYLDGEE